MENLHATSIGTYNVCPYKFKYDKWYIDPKNTFPWDILNIAVTNEWDYEPRLNYFVRNYGMTFKDKEMLKDIYDSVRVKLKEYKDMYGKVYQETKFVYKYDDSITFVGTPDMFVYDALDDIYIIVDWKTSANLTWYEWETIWNESFQPIIYSKFLMEYFNISETVFRFEVFNKKNAKSEKFERRFTKDFVNNKINDIVNEYKKSNILDSWKCNKWEYPDLNRYCNFCSLKKTTCPAWNKSIKRVEVIEDEF